MTVVYVLISGEKDLYYEQALVSLYSLRLYNPDINVVVLTDDITAGNLNGKRGGLEKLGAKIQVVDVPQNYTPKERSRFIKTSFRHFLKGDLLFIDTDTVITDDLSAVDKIDAEIAAVVDYHAPISKLIDADKLRTRMQDIFGADISDEKLYFNSGVIYMKDTPNVRNLFDEWHRYWKIAAFEKDQCYDQPALMMADRSCGHLIQELDGIYNCQVLTSIQYLSKAKIIHFFNNCWEGKETLSPFLDNEFFRKIKVEGGLTEADKNLISDAKSAFYSPDYFMCIEQVKFFSTIVGATFFSLYKKNNLTYRLIAALCKFRFFLTRFKK